VDAQTGKPLWHFNTGQNLHASPMSYAVNGKQYVPSLREATFLVLGCLRETSGNHLNRQLGAIKL
jgi:hypothetical protein